MTDEGTTDLELVSNLNEQFGKISISLTDSSGQMRSSYDILYDLSKIWGTLDKNTKVYIAELVAGKNQVDVFNSLLSNFKSAVSANETAINSAGSAARENATYMESLEAKVSSLKQSFQELSTSIIDNDLVKVVLDMANGLLEIANTPVGNFALVATGITAVVVAIASLWSVLKLGKAFAAVFAGGAKTLAGGLAALNIPLIAAIAGISLLVTFFPQVKDFVEGLVDPIGKATQKIKENNTQIDENKARLKELKDTPWNDRTSEIQAEIDKLEKLNEKLEESTEKYKKRQAKKAKEAVTGSYDSRGVGEYYMASGDHYRDLTEKQDKLNKKVAEGIELAPKEVEQWKNNNKELSSFTSNVKIATEGGEKLDKSLIKVADSASGTTKEYASLNQKLDDHEKAVKISANGYKIASDQAKEFISSNAGLTDSIGDLNGQFYIEKDALSQLAQAGNEVARQIIKDQKDQTIAVIENTKKRIQALKIELQAYGKTLPTTASIPDFLKNQKSNLPSIKNSGIMQSQEKDLLSFALKTNQDVNESKIKELQELETEISSWGIDSEVASPSLKKNKGGGSSSSKKEQTDPIEEQNKLFKEQISILEDRLYILQKSGVPEEEQVKQLQKMQQVLHEQAQWYRSKGVAENSQYLRDLGKQWWDYQNQVQSVYDNIKKAASEAAEKEKEERKAQLESNKNAYEMLFSYMSDNIDKELDTLQNQRDTEEKYWDAKIQALQDQNDEIERQIELETLQSNLAKARQSQVMVYKDGKFQYAKNIDEISQAQTALDSYQREQALTEETERLENLKDKALASIDKQIESWEDYKKEWSSVATDYQKEQDKLLIEQQLGIKLEGDNWKNRLDNLSDYVSQYKDLMSQLDTATVEIEEKLPTTSVGGTSGGKTGQSVRPGGAIGGAIGSIIGGPIGGIIGSIAGSISSIGSKPSQDIGGRAGKAKKYATGTLSAEGGISLVGDGGGPELRVLNQGDGIIPHNITKNLLELGSNPYAYMGNAYRNLAGNASHSTSYSFDISKLELPNAKDAPSLVEGLKRYAYQYTAQRK